MTGHGETAELQKILAEELQQQKWLEYGKSKKWFEKSEADPEMVKYWERWDTNERIYWQWEHECNQFILLFITPQKKLRKYSDVFTIERLNEAIKYFEQRCAQCRNLKFHVELLSNRDAMDLHLVRHTIGDFDHFSPNYMSDGEDTNIIGKYAEYKCPKKVSNDLQLLELQHIYIFWKMRKLAKRIWNWMTGNMYDLNAYGIYATCYLQTFIMHKASVYYIFAKSEGLKLLFANLKQQPIQKRNIYSVLITAKFLQFVIKNFAKICKLIFHSKHKLYKQLFLFWKNYMKFYWEQKQNMFSKTKAFIYKLMIDKMNIIPLIVHTMKGYADSDGRLTGAISFYMIKDKYLIYEWILDLIAGILTNTIEESKLYWISGKKEINIMRYLLSKSNCKFLFNWFIQQYKANIKYYQESNIGQYIYYYDRYFWQMKPSDSIWIDEDDIEEDEKSEFQMSIFEYAKIEFNIQNICKIREMIGRYYENNKDRLLADGYMNICTTPRELFTQWRLYKCLLSLQRKEKKIGNSPMVYYRVINRVINGYGGFREITPIKELYKGQMLRRIQCGFDCCGNTKRDVKMYICKGCHFVRYCCRKCQKKDWNKYHRNICKILVIFS
eukprot:10377_1